MAYKQKNNPFKKKNAEKEILTFHEQVARSGTDPYAPKGDLGSTGFDDRSIVNPRTYDALEKLQDTTSYGDLIRSQLISSEFQSDAEKRRKKYTPDQETRLTDFDRAKQDIIDKTNKMDADQFNSIVTELSNFGSQFKGKSNIKKLTTLLDADLSGMKRVAGELGISKNQIMDLVKAPENASLGDKLKVKAIRAYLNAKL
tara:strand:+ start:1579 stop:2178 length:600 start_codon:yes stop_codon:yes gene_type:complete